MFKDFSVRSQRVENLRRRIGFRKFNLGIKPIFNPAILPLVLVGSRKLNSNQLSFLIILLRHEHPASVLCFTGFGLTLFDNLAALAVRYE